MANLCYPRKYTWCVLAGTGHQWLCINSYRLVEHSQEKRQHFNSLIFSSKYIYRTNPIYRLVPNTAKFQVPDLFHLPASKAGALHSFFSLFGSSPPQCPQFSLTWGAGHRKLSLLTLLLWSSQGTKAYSYKPLPYTTVSEVKGLNNLWHSHWEMNDFINNAWHHTSFTW